MDRIIVYASRKWDASDKIATITEEEYKLLEPWKEELRLSNSIPEEVGTLVWETIYNRAKSIHSDGIPDNYDIEVAIC